MGFGQGKGYGDTVHGLLGADETAAAMAHRGRTKKCREPGKGLRRYK